jgi:putative flippase GtrA
MPTRVSGVWRGDIGNTTVRSIRYAAAGSCAFALDFFALFFLTSCCRVHYLASAALAFALGVTASYALSVTWAADRQKIKDRWSEFVIFAAIGTGGLLLNEAFIWFFTDIVLVYYLVSKVLSSVFVHIYNFVARKVVLVS